MGKSKCDDLSHQGQHYRGVGRGAISSKNMVKKKKEVEKRRKRRGKEKKKERERKEGERKLIMSWGNKNGIPGLAWK